MAFSPDGHTLAIGSADRDIRLWNVTDPAHPQRTGPVLTGPSGYVYSVAFSPSGRTLAAADSAGLVWLWDTHASGAAAEICTMAGQPLTHTEWQTYLPGRRYTPPCLR